MLSTLCWKTSIIRLSSKLEVEPNYLSEAKASNQTLACHSTYRQKAENWQRNPRWYCFRNCIFPNPLIKRILRPSFKNAFL